MSKIDFNEHLYRALYSVQAPSSTDLDPINDRDTYINVKGPKVTFSIQEGPVKEFGRNGCDATDIIRYAIGLYSSFNNAFPCRENSLTITKLEEALHWQEARTRDRVNRGVEGKSQA